MENLFMGKIAAIFDAMYQSFIDYDEEYAFYNKLIHENKCNSMLEIGCGTGNLAKRFLDNNHNYLGLDFSQNMIDIALEKNKTNSFIHGDMRKFVLEAPVDAIIISERSTSYLVNNEDVIDAFESVYNNLTSNGIFIFDFIDANRFIPFIKENPNIIIHEANFEGESYLRESHWETTPLDNFILDWSAKYYKLVDGEKELFLDDFSAVRVYTLNEMQLFLYLNKFEILEIIDRKTYAFDTYVIKARKML